MFGEMKSLLLPFRKKQSYGIGSTLLVYILPSQKSSKIEKISVETKYKSYTLEEMNRQHPREAVFFEEREFFYSRGGCLCYLILHR